MDIENKQISVKEFGVAAHSKLSSLESTDGPNRITLMVENYDGERYLIPMSKPNARWLIDKLKAAIKLA